MDTFAAVVALKEGKQSPEDSPAKWTVMWSFYVSLADASCVNKLLNKQSNY